MAKRIVAKDIVSQSVRSRMMRAVGHERTREEEVVARLLRSLGVRCTRNDARLAGSPDFAHRTRRWVIFVHGCFWHGHLHCPVTKSRDKPRVPVRQSTFWATKLADNRRRDRRKADQLRSSGFRVMTIWGCQLRDPDRVRRRLMTFLDADRQSPRR